VGGAGANGGQVNLLRRVSLGAFQGRGATAFLVTNETAVGENKDSGEFEKTGDVSKVRVTLWRDLATNADIQKGDLVEISATLVEKEFQKKDGTTGRSLQTDWVESVVVKHRKDAGGNAGGF
jgi:single-stranded DNA-binding protein